MEIRYSADTFLAISEKWCEILSAKADIEEIRTNLIHHINHRQFESYSDKSDLHDLDLVIIRDCARVWRAILHPRSEKLAGFSVLRELIKAANNNPDPDLSESFWADIYYLTRGIEGQFQLHNLTLFSFSGIDELSGREAAIIRSQELDMIQNYVNHNTSKYKSGLDDDIKKIREQNLNKILKAKNIDLNQWYNWKWQLQNIAKDEETLSLYASLSQKEISNVRKAVESHIPFGVTPYYASLFIDPIYGEDRAIRAQVLFPENYINTFNATDNNEYITDYMKETDTSPIDLITRRYPSIVILKPYNSCPQICVYCQRNWEIKGPLDPQAMANQKTLHEALQWLKEHKTIKEVLVTGGDPLVMSDEIIESLLNQLSQIPHIERIRIGTRTPVTIPMRFTDDLCNIIASFRKPGRREITLMTHVQHPYEITEDFVDAIEKLKSRGISVYNQLVYTFFISRRFEAAHLRHLLRLCGVDPYYSFYPKGKVETNNYRIPIARMLQEQKEEARLMPGLSRTDEPVFNIPGLGKNNLNSWQHRDFISILKDGSRVYEFHPWEKKIADQKTYIGSDVPIFEYLKRLEEIGENSKDYETIWYYF
ncbi:MAG TPA: KamA family radical SAM protein [Spirochaetota bacterium]|nr:KamA family radical SAM protein [Spirochaetota bacterium]